MNGFPYFMKQKVEKKSFSIESNQAEKQNESSYFPPDGCNREMTYDEPTLLADADDDGCWCGGDDAAVSLMDRSLYA